MQLIETRKYFFGKKKHTAKKFFLSHEEESEVIGKRPLLQNCSGNTFSAFARNTLQHNKESHETDSVCGQRSFVYIYHITTLLY